jgi:hypothetical protein
MNSDKNRIKHMRNTTHKELSGLQNIGKAMVLAFTGLAACVSAFGQVSDDPLENWEWRNPLPTGGTLWKIEFANGQFLAVGTAGEILTTADGKSWSYVISGTTETLIGVTYGGDPGNGLYVAVGEAGTIVTSPDSVNWTLRDSGIDADLTGVAYGNGTFIAVGYVWTVANGYVEKILSSTNGIDWTEETSTTGTRLATVIFTENQFVAVGGVPNSSASVLTSPDGKTWTEQTTPVTQFLTGITYGGSLYVAVGESGTIISSSDGLTWVSQASATIESLQSVTYADGQFVTVGFEGTILTSPDGIAWTSRIGSGILLTVEYGNFRYVAAGFSSVLISATGNLWEEVSEGTKLPLNALTFGSGIYVAVGEDGTALSSISGLLWKVNTSGVDVDLYEAASGGGSHVAAGAGGTIITSDDGIAWSTRESQTTASIFALTYGENQYMAVDFTGAVLKSTDGQTWVTDGNVGFVQPRCMTYANGITIVAGASGNIRYSTNGTSWSSANSGTNLSILDVTYGSAGFVAVGQLGIALRSQNGLSWTAVSTGVLSDLNGISYGPEGYVASGINGVILTSQDGITWTSRYSRTNNALNSSIYANGLYLVSGRSGAILAAQVDPGKPLVNLSTRGFVGTGTERMIAGFVLSGGTSPVKTVLIRAAGPSLGPLGVTGFLADPFLEVKSGPDTVITNDNWGDFTDQTALAEATAKVGAFDLIPNSKDSSLLVDLPNGKYTALVTGVNATTGVSIVEVYDVSQGIDDPRMVNISTRLKVGTGEEQAVPGFVIEGERPKAVLIRAVGPTLGDLINDPDIVLSDPQLSVMDGDTAIFTNNNWGEFDEQAALQAATVAVGAFPLRIGSKDAAGLVILDPGAYTIKVSGADGGSGLALVEVYEVQ